MSGVCKNTPAITSEAQLTATFTGSILPPIGSGRIASGELKGRLTNQKLEEIYTTLVQRGDLVSNASYRQSLTSVATQKDTNATKAILTSIGSKEDATMRKLQDEYCFTYVRYKYTLETLFDALVATSKRTTLTDAERTDIQSKLQRAKTYNEKLNDILQFTNFLALKRSSEMRTQSSEINQLNSSIQSTYDVLQSHGKMLRSETSLSDLRKRMVEYTEEKNRSATNLLSLYGFLNLVAVGLLVYLARS